MIQQSLFDPNPQVHKKTKGEEARENLDRVRSRIEQAILDFFRISTVGTEFHAEDLCGYIQAKGLTCAPDSPGRIMRALRREGSVSYVVVSRKESLYRVNAL